MVEGKVSFVPARLSFQLAVDKRFEKLAQQATVLVELRDIQPQERARQPRIAQVQLWRLDQPLDSVAVPRRQEIDEKDLFKKSQVIADVGRLN